MSRAKAVPAPRESPEETQERVNAEAREEGRKLYSREELELRKLAAECSLAEANAARVHRWFSIEATSAYDARTFTFASDTNAEDVTTAMDFLGDWQRQSDDPITVILNSPGGSVYAGLALYDRLVEVRQAGIEVVTVGYGYAASMGGILLQAGSTRRMTPNAHLLIHEVSSWSRGKVTDMGDDVEHCTGLYSRLLDLLAERSTLTREQIRRRAHRKDWWLSADEALDLGFIDEIGGATS